MPESPQRASDRRLEVWRYAYALFDKERPWEGPFYSAGYRDPVIEPTLDNDKHPDMLAVNENFFAVLEVSYSANKEFANVREYARGGLTPFLKTLVGDRARSPSGTPFFVTTESRVKAFPPEMNAVRVTPPVEMYLPNVADPVLKSSLDGWGGFPTPVPNYSLLAVPESEPEEIRLQVAGMLKRTVSEGGEFNAERLADFLLGDMAEAVTPAGKARLARNVATLLEIAASKLGGYVEWVSQSKTLKVQRIETAQGRAAFSKALSDWAQVPFLESFSVYPPEGLSEDTEND